MQKSECANIKPTGFGSGKSLCTSFLKGARSHFSHSPCYFPVPSSCSVFSAAFLLLAVWWLDQKSDLCTLDRGLLPRSTKARCICR